MITLIIVTVAMGLCFTILAQALVTGLTHIDEMKKMQDCRRSLMLNKGACGHCDWCREQEDERRRESLRLEDKVPEA